MDDNLIKCGMDSVSCCHFCGGAAETARHVFFECTSASQLWAGLPVLSTVTLLLISSLPFFVSFKDA